MKNKGNKDEIPESFSSYDEAGAFWDTHDSADYAEDLVPVDVEVSLKKRHFEIEVDEEVVKALERLSRSRGKPPSRIANDLLKKDLALA